MLKRLLPNTLFGRALLMIVTPLVVVELVAAYVFFERHWETVSRRLALGVAGDIAMVIRSLPHYAEPGERSRYLAAVARNYNLAAEILPGAELSSEPAPVSLGSERLARVLAKTLRERLDRPFRIDTESYPGSVEIRVDLDDGALRGARFPQTHHQHNHRCVHSLAGRHVACPADRRDIVPTQSDASNQAFGRSRRCVRKGSRERYHQTSGGNRDSPGHRCFHRHARAARSANGGTYGDAGWGLA